MAQHMTHFSQPIADTGVKKISMHAAPGSGKHLEIDSLSFGLGLTANGESRVAIALAEGTTQDWDQATTWLVKPTSEATQHLLFNEPIKLATNKALVAILKLNPANVVAVQAMVREVND